MLKDDGYRNLFRTLPRPLAYNRFIYDRDGRPTDFIILEINEAFEKVTGLKAAEVKGKRPADIGLQFDPAGTTLPPLLTKIADSGQYVHFEHFYEPAQSWYAVTAFVDRPGYFVFLLENITARRKESGLMETLVNVSKNMLSASFDDLDYNRIVSDLKELSGSRYVALNIYDYKKGISVTRALAGVAADFEKAAKILGFSFENRSWPLQARRIEAIRGGKLVHYDSLFAASHGVLPGPVAGSLSRIFNVGSVYVIDLAHSGDDPIGDLIFFMPRGELIKNREAVETYILQAGSIIGRLRAEKELVDKNAEMQGFFDVALDLLCIADTEGNFIKVNKSWEEILGYRAEELEQKKFLEFVHPDDMDSTLAAMAVLENQDEVLNFTNRYRCRDGSYRYIEWRSYPQGKIIYAAARDITERKHFEAALKESNDRYNQLAEQGRTIIWEIDREGLYTYISPVVEKVLGYKPEELIGQVRFYDLHPDRGREAFKTAAFKVFNSKEPFDNVENLAQTRDGRLIWFSSNGLPIFGPSGELLGHRGSDTDITARKRAEQALRESEVRSRALVEAVPDMLFRFNRSGDYLDAQVKDEKMLHPTARAAYREVGLIGKNIRDVLPEEISVLMLETIEKVIDSGELDVVEYSYDNAFGPQHFEARLAASGANEAVSIVRDITEKKQYEAELQYLSMHDSLTGLYNRAYFDNELERLQSGRDFPVAVIAADLDGLKLVNDILGHKEGDRILRACAGLLKESLRSSDILARVGGDEFALILPRTGSEAGKELVKRIHGCIAKYNEKGLTIPLSISMGVAVCESGEQSLEETFKMADGAMYKDKLQRSSEARGEIVRALLARLYNREGITMAYNEQVQELCIKLGRQAGMDEGRLANLQLLAQVYDLGKVTIPEEIIGKKGKLGEDEYEIVRQHSEKGYRIAAASPDLAVVADYILRHHENWDGSGYPLGIGGAEIPLESRILAVVNSFCAMTNPRSYAPAMDHGEALRELKRCSGRQYDPGLVEMLVNIFAASRQLD